MRARLSFFAYLACMVLMLYTTLVFYPKWNKPGGESTLGWDVSGYYWYLPAALLYGDLKHQQFGDSIIAKYQLTPSFSQSYVHESGNRVITYSSGMAVMYLPFFLTAHVLAGPLGYPADGFSVPYRFALQTGSLLAALLALWYFRKLFLTFYDDRVVAILLLLLVFGTNYLNYAAIENALTHNWLFMLYVFLLLNTIYFHRTPGYKYAVRIGMLCGLIIFIRPSEMICVLIPLVWGLERLSVGAIKTRTAFLKQHWSKILAAACCVVAIGSIQVAYWFYVTGRPLVYSYRDQGFSWLHPHLADYMFSYRSGWITYTPLVILCFIGVPLFVKNGKNKIAILSFFVLNLYIVSAWDVWWYGGTGGRAMIQSYPLIMFPMAALLGYLMRHRVLGWIVSPVIILLAYFNIWFTYNAHAGNALYDPNGMTKEYYWNVIYRYRVDPEIEKLMDTDELFRGRPGKMYLRYANGFETSADTAGVQIADTALNGKFSAMIGSGVEYISLPIWPYAKPLHEWVRAEGIFYCRYREWSIWNMPCLVVRFYMDNRIVKERRIRLHRYLYNGQTKRLYIDVKVPDEPVNSAQVFIWNPGSPQSLAVDDIKVWSFDER